MRSPGLFTRSSATAEISEHRLNVHKGLRSTNNCGSNFFYFADTVPQSREMAVWTEHSIT